MARKRSSKNRGLIVRLPAPSHLTKKKKSKQEELTKLGKIFRELGGFGGGFVGNMIGHSDEGKGIGRSIGATISKWLGSGDYTVKSNSILNASSAIPGMHSNNQTVTVRHKEFLGIINSTTDFTVAYSYNINPGLEQTFPWMSRIAQGFQEYAIKGMVYHYVPSSGSAVAAANPALGTVMMQTTYRSTDSAPLSKIEMLNEYWSSESVPSQSFCHPIECDPKENPFNVHYVRTGTVPSTDTALMYDLGKTFVATQGMQTVGNPVGDLWCTYEIELKKPIMTSAATSFTNFAQLYSVSSSITTANYFAGTQDLTGNLAITAASTGKTFYFPIGITGIYHFDFVVIATGGSGFTANNMDGTSITVTNGIRALVNTTRGTYTDYSYDTASTNNCVHIHCKNAVVITDPGKQCSILYGTNTWTGTPISSILTVYCVG